MRTKLTITNYKCFENQDIDLKQLTILAGANSAGKSSVIQSLLLSRVAIERVQQLTQTTTTRSGSLNNWIGSTPIPLNNVYHLALGNTAEVLNREANEDVIRIKFEEDSLSLKLQMDVPRDKDAYDLNLTACQAHIVPPLSILQPHFYYLNAERIGPRLDYKVESLPFPHVGYDGAYTIQIFQKLRDEKVSFNRAFDEHQLLDYSMQVALWMNFITPGVEINVPSLYEKVRTVEMAFGKSSPTNIGFGVSYVLPIVVNGLLASQGSMMIVENPEAHLHPSGQSRIGRFLAKVAAAGVQVVVETHSEHVINGIRIASLEPDFGITNHDILINFFQKDKTTGKSVVQPISITDSGDLSKFPRDFFDQAQQDLTTLIKLKRQRS
jgi:predicted ATPase